jgi:hypothetical protein
MAVANKKTGTLSSVVDYWNAAYRGFVPGGLNQVAPEITDIGPDPVTVDMPDDPYVNPDPEVELEQNIVPVPVVLMDDLSHTRKRVEIYPTTFTANVDGVTPRILLPRDPYRTQAIIQNLGLGSIYLGHNESVGNTGFALALGQLVVLSTTRELWAIQQSAQATVAQVSVLCESARDTA